jgi:polyvinyl alcohol dehydrogenase (cytochrome)
MRGFVAILLAAPAALAQTPDGAALFRKHCGTCHRPGSETRAPLPEVLSQIPSQKIADSLEKGTMKAQAAMLSAAERTTVVNFLAKATVTPETAAGGKCAVPAPKLANIAGWNGWGVDLENTRFQAAKAAGLTASQVPKLKLKWAFGIPNATVAYGQPTIADGRLFFGTADGTVYSLDAATGCSYWTFKAPATVRSAVTLGPIANGRYAAYFGDVQANVYAVDAQNGELLWKMKADTHPVARITAAPKLHEGRLYVPVSSIEEVPASNANYTCCTFRGSVITLDAATGKQIWKTYAIPDAPQPTRKNSAGAQLMGPAGAAIWSSPTLDVKRKLVYVATGNAYSEPHTKFSDAILAFDMENGSLKWSQQMTPNDGWNFSCINPAKTSCPEQAGEDLDFGSSPILKAVKGRDLLVVGQKSGIVHALDPEEQGKILWQVRIGKGGALGGIEWGSAADDENVYVALSDFIGRNPNDAGGLFALRLATGERAWYAEPVKPACLGKPGCSPAQMAPVTAIPGVVFSGSMDGRLRAHATADGALLWDFDTLREFETVNGVKARGGSLNATGPTIYGGMMFVNSGYGALGGMAGNVLLAFATQ